MIIVRMLPLVLVALAIRVLAALVQLKLERHDQWLAAQGSTLFILLPFLSLDLFLLPTHFISLLLPLSPNPHFLCSTSHL